MNVVGVDIHALEGPELISRPALMETLQRLRVDAWVSVGLPESAVIDSKYDRDRWDSYANSTHWLVFHEGELVAAARLSVHSDVLDMPASSSFLRHIDSDDFCLPIAMISRLVVRADFRGKGLSSRLDEIRLEKARSQGANRLLALASKSRCNALSRLGFVIHGPVESAERAISWPKVGFERFIASAIL